MRVAAPRRTVVSGAPVFDGTRSLGVCAVVVEDGVIARVEPGGGDVAGVPADEQVDGRGATLLPGLIDAHTHLRGLGNLEQSLRYGVTTVLDMFSAPPALTARARAETSRRSDLADLRSAGLMAGADGGWPGAMLPPDPSGWRMPGLRGPGDADAFVADRLAEGSDYLKIFVENGDAVGRPALSAETVAALCTVARRHGLLAVAHAPTLWAARTALAAGVDVVTHLPLDGVLSEGDAAAAAAAGVVAVPTLSMMDALTDPAGPRRLLADPRLTRRLGTGVADDLAAGDRGGLPVSSAVGASYAHAAENLALLHRAGVPILAGTDANDVPGHAAAVLHGASTHLELELLVDAGLTPAAALAAATALPARSFGLADRGRVAETLRADLLLVDGDPLTDITATRRVLRVWRAGTSLTPEETRDV